MLYKANIITKYYMQLTTLGAIFKDYGIKQGTLQIFESFKDMSFANKALIATAAITATYKAIEYLQSGWTRAGEAASKATSEFENANSELESLKSQKDTQKNRIQEIAAKYNVDSTELQDANGKLKNIDQMITTVDSHDGISLVDRAELDSISSANSQLEAQLAIQEQITEAKKQAMILATEKAASTNKTYFEQMKEEYGAFEGFIKWIQGQGHIEIDNRGERVFKEKSESDKFYGDNNDSTNLGLFKTRLSELQEYKSELKYLDEEISKSEKNGEKFSKDTIDRRNELADSIANSSQDLAGLVDIISSQMEVLSQSDSSFALSWVEDAKKAINDFNNIDLSPAEKALSELDFYFDGSSGKNALKKQLTDAAKSGKDLEKVLNRMGLSISDLGANVDADLLKQYFDGIKSSAQEAEKATKNYKASVSDVEEAAASENQDKNWSTIQSSYEAAKKLLKEGKTGTDDFQTMASFLNPKKVKEYAEQGGKYTADAYQKAFQEIQATADRWFGEDETKSMENFVNDFKNKGLWDVSIDDKGLWDISTKFETTAKAADEFGVSIEAVETMLHGLEAYGYDFSNIMFSGESLSEYESALNEIKTIYDGMMEGSAKDKLGNLIEGFDKELAGFEDDMSSLTEDKIIHIQFEYDLASIQAEIDAIDRKEATGGEVGRTERSDRIGYRDLKYEEQKEGFGFNNKDIEIPVQFKAADDAVSKAKDELEKAAKGGNEVQIKDAQIKVENAQKIRDEIANSFDEWNQAQEIPLNINSNIDEIKAAIEKFKTQPTTINVDAKLNKEEVETAMSSMENESIITFSANYGDLETQIAAIKDQEGNITYYANVDGEPTEVELEKDGTIKYDADMSKAKAAKAPEKSSLVNYAAKFLAAAPPILTGTVRYNAVVSVANAGANIAGKVLSNLGLGSHGVDGSAHAEGTAKASGDWSVKRNETALTGEVGQEVVVRKGKFFTVGDNGAELVDLQKGDIVFNHKQTEELFKHGYVTSNGGRGKVIGEAHAEGTAYRLGSGGSGGGSKPKIKPASSSSPTPASNNSSSSDSANDFKETIDYIEMAIDRIERQIKNLERIAGSAYNTFSKRNTALKDQISSITDEISTQQAGYERYIQEANSVSLSEDYKNKVRNGTIDISTITDESLANNIKDFQQWYEKALDCRDAVEELKESVRDLYKEAFDNVVTLYDGMLGQIEHRHNILEGYIDQTETQGYIVSTKYYDALLTNEQEKLEKLTKQRQDLITAMNDAIANGSIEMHSESWYSMQQDINDVNEAIQEAETGIVEFGNSIRELKWDIFDKIQDRISAITDESDFLIKLMSNKDMYDDKGKVTDHGTAAYGLHGANYNVYMSQADQYRKEMEAIEKAISEDPYNETLIERRKELLELQQESILAAEDEKQAMKDLVEDGIKKQLDALNELIDKYLETLESQKDMYDYQNKIDSQQKEVSSLEKQLAAYAGDDSEEGNAKRQQVQNSLEEARKKLEETQYEKAISEQKKLLDELYTEYETVLNMRLDNIDQLISEIIANVNQESSSIRDTLVSEAESVGYKLTDSMNTIWGTSGTIAGILTTYSTNFSSVMTNVQTAINDIKLLVQSAVNKSDKTADANINKSKNDQTQQTTPPPASKPTSTPNNTNKKGGGDGVPRVGDVVTLKAGERYYYSSWGNTPTGNMFAGVPGGVKINGYSASKYGGQASRTGAWDVSISSADGKYELGWVKLSQIEGYKSGTDFVDRDKIALTQEGGRELIVSRSDGAMITPLKRGDAVFTNSETERLLNLVNDPTDYMQNNLKKLMPGVTPMVSIPNAAVTNISVNIGIDRVMDYDDFIRQFQNDAKTERLVQSMTIDRLTGKNSLGKYNVRL